MSRITDMARRFWNDDCPEPKTPEAIQEKLNSVGDRLRERGGYRDPGIAPPTPEQRAAIDSVFDRWKTEIDDPQQTQRR